MVIHIILGVIWGREDILSFSHLTYPKTSLDLNSSELICLSQSLASLFIFGVREILHLNTLNKHIDLQYLC